MEIIVEKHIQKKLQKFPKHVAKDFIEAIEMLRDFPFAKLDIRKLKGQKEKMFRIRIGKYRIIFILEDSIIRIAEIGIRGKGYE